MCCYPCYTGMLDQTLDLGLHGYTQLPTGAPLLPHRPCWVLQEVLQATQRLRGANLDLSQQELFMDSLICHVPGWCQEAGRICCKGCLA